MTVLLTTPLLRCWMKLGIWWTVSCYYKWLCLLPLQLRWWRNCHQPGSSPRRTWPQPFRFPWRCRSPPFLKRVRHSLRRLSEEKTSVGRGYSESLDRRDSSVRRCRHHGGDVAKALQVLHYTALMCRLHAGEAPRGGADLPLQVGGQLIKLSTCEANDCTLLLLLLLHDDTHPATDRQGCPFVVTLNQKQDHL